MRKLITALAAVAFLGCGDLTPDEQGDDATQATRQALVGRADAGSALPDELVDPVPNELLEAEPDWAPADGLFRQSKDRKEEHFFYPVKIRPAPPTSTPQCPPCT